MEKNIKTILIAACLVAFFWTTYWAIINEVVIWNKTLTQSLGASWWNYLGMAASIIAGLFIYRLPNSQLEASGTNKPNQTTQHRMLTLILAALLIATLICGVGAAALSQTQYSPTAENTETTPQAEVTYNVEKSLDGSGWNTIGASGTITNWFCRIITTATGYSGSATVDWQLQKSTDSGSTWTDILGTSVTTTCTFDGTASQLIYATSDGSASGNIDWATAFTETAHYRIAVNPQTV